MNHDVHKRLVQNAVGDKFRREDLLPSKTAPKYPNSAEREYKRLANAYMDLLNRELKKELPAIMKVYTRNLNEDAADARYDGLPALKSMLETMFQRIFDKLEQAYATFDLKARVGKVSWAVKNSAIREWRRTVKATLGIDLMKDYYDGAFYEENLHKWVDDNVNYIKTLPTDTLKEMQQIIYNGYLNGKPVRDLATEIQSAYNVSRSYAKFVARDQIGTLNAQITKHQQEDAGVTQYKWSTSRDERVRDCHRALEGQIFDWDNPPEMWYVTKRGLVRTGRRCHPGEDYNCRCCAIPVFNRNTIDLPIEALTDGDEAR